MRLALAVVVAVLIGCSSNGKTGPQGPQGPKGDPGVQGPKGDTGLQGPPSGMRVMTADGTPLGNGYGVTTGPGTGVVGGVNPSAAMPDTWVLLFEQPLAGSAGAFVWRNAADGSPILCNATGAFWMAWSGLGCTGMAYFGNGGSVPLGFACRAASVPAGQWRLYKGIGPVQTNVPVASEGSASGCSNLDPTTVLTVAIPVVDLGPASNLPAPLLFLPP